MCFDGGKVRREIDLQLQLGDDIGKALPDLIDAVREKKIEPVSLSELLNSGETTEKNENMPGAETESS